MELKQHTYLFVAFIDSAAIPCARTGQGLANLNFVKVCLPSGELERDKALHQRGRDIRVVHEHFVAVLTVLRLTKRCRSLEQHGSK